MDGTLFLSATVNELSKRAYYGPLVSRSGIWGSEGHLGTIWEEGLEGRSEGQFWSILRSILVNSEVNEGLRLKKTFIWPWVGPQPQKYMKYGSWEGTGPGYRYSPPRPTPPPHHPGYTPPPRHGVHTTSGMLPRAKYGRGAQIRRPTHLRYTILRV